MAQEVTPTVDEILNRALDKEKAAFRYYDRLLGSANIDLIRDLLQELKNEEYKHIKMIEDMLDHLNLL
jgi:rubrerythrin